MSRLPHSGPDSLLPLALLLLAAPLSMADDTRAAPEQRSSTCAADHPLVELVLKARKAAVHLNPSPLKGPDAQGNYLLADPRDVRSINVYTRASHLDLLSADDIVAIAEHFPCIESLHLKSETAALLWAPELKHFTSLQELAIRLTLPRKDPPKDSKEPPWTPQLHKQVSAATFDQFSHLPRLKKLNLNCEYREESIKKLACLKDLRELHLTHFERGFSTYAQTYIPPENDFTAQTLSRTVAQLPRLELLDMACCELRGPIDWQALARLTNLHTLLLPKTGLNDEQLAGIEQLEHLRKIDVSKNPITGKSLSHIGQLETLETLDLSETGVSDNVLALANLPNLEWVDYPGEGLAEKRLSAAELEVVLRTCTRDTVAVEDPTAVPLGRIQKLFPGGIESLNISDAKDSPSIRLAGPSEPGHLMKILLLRHRPLTHRDLEEIEQLTGTRYLTVATSSEGRINSEMLASLLRMPNLESLGLVLGSPTGNADILPLLAQHPTLQHVRLTKVPLDARAARHLASIPNLQSLSISDSQVHSAAWPLLAEAKNLKALTFGGGVRIAGHPGERFRGIAQLKSLRSLTALSRIGNDHECRWIGHCRTLETLILNGTFSNVGLARLTPMPDLQKLTLRGTVTVTEDGLAVLGRNPKLEWAAITNTDGNPEKNVYSEVISKEHEIGFAGACSCGCMDIEQPKALVLQRDRFTIQDDRLVIHPNVLATLDLTRDETDEPWNGKLRITAPIRRERLRIQRSDLPKRLTHLYLNHCQVDRLDLVDCLKEEIGVFGESRVGSLHLYESRGYDPDGYGDRFQRIASVSLYLGDVRELTVHSASTLIRLGVYEGRTLRSLHLEGRFPQLVDLRLGEAPQLKYLAAPYSGSAPKLRISTHGAKRLPELRLLKAPGTASPGVASLLSGSRPHPPLHEVDVRRCAIEDKYLKVLAEVSTLRILRIAGCKSLTPEAIARFKSVRPEVHVVQTE